MYRKGESLIESIDWVTIFLYIVLVFFGWTTIYSANYTEGTRIIDIGHTYGKQFVWMGVSILVAMCILIVEGEFYAKFAYVIYAVCIFLLLLVMLVGVEINGARSWFKIGGFRFQPAELSKFATLLAVAKYLSTPLVSITNYRSKLIVGGIVFLPFVLIVIQGDMGTALVFTSILLVLYREGLSSLYLIVGISILVLSIFSLLFGAYLFVVLSVLIVMGLIAIYFFRNKKIYIVYTLLVIGLSSGYIFAVDYMFNHFLEPHQKERINVLLGKGGDNWNVTQSLIAIGSGQIAGKGYLKGTQNKLGFLPEQGTDFIFCTIAEERGFIGSVGTILLFVGLMWRLVFLADRQRSSFTRIYAYGVMCILLLHFVINIGMTIGLVPVIGIPLPFISYGGSSLLSFTILLFILLKLDAQRKMVLR